MKSCIYRIINLTNNKSYIGSTKNIDVRINQHIKALRSNKHHNNYLQHTFNLVGERYFIFHIIECCDFNKLEEFEQIYIDGLCPEYNICKDTKAPMRFRKHSQKSIQKMSGKTPWNKNVPRTKEEKEYISERIKIGYAKKPPEYWDMVSKRAKDRGLKPFLGKHHTEENKKALRKQRISTKNNKIFCLNNEKIYLCQLDAAKELNIKQGHISECCHGKRDNAGGFIFRFMDQKTPPYESKKQRVKDNNNVYYDSITEACIALKLDRTQVNNFRNGIYVNNNITLTRISDDEFFSNYKLRYR